MLFLGFSFREGRWVGDLGDFGAKANEGIGQKSGRSGAKNVRAPARWEANALRTTKCNRRASRLQKTKTRMQTRTNPWRPLIERRQHGIAPSERCLFTNNSRD